MHLSVCHHFFSPSQLVSQSQWLTAKATDPQWTILFMFRRPMIRILIRPIHDGSNNNNVSGLNGLCDLLKAYSPTPVCHSSFFWPQAAVVFTPFPPPNCRDCSSTKYFRQHKYVTVNVSWKLGILLTWRSSSRKRWKDSTWSVWASEYMTWIIKNK